MTVGCRDRREYNISIVFFLKRGDNKQSVSKAAKTDTNGTPKERVCIQCA